MSNYSFHKDLKRAEDTEAFVVDILVKHFGKSFIEACWGGASKYYDIELVTTFLNVRLEVKEDFYCKKSGNIAIEYMSRGKESGISTSRAKFWLIMAHTNQGRVLYSIRASKLREMIDNEEYVRDVKGGDAKTSCMYLFKLTKIDENAMIIWEE